MAGLARITKMFDTIVINGQRFVWDYVADEAVPEREMPSGSERHKASERRRIEALRRDYAAQKNWEFEHGGRGDG